MPAAPATIAADKKVNAAAHAPAWKDLAVFFALAYLISWVLWLPLYARQVGLEEMPLVPYNHALGGLGPLIAAILAAFRQQADDRRKFLRSFMRWRSLPALITAVCLPFVLLIIAGLLSGKELREFSDGYTSDEFPGFGALQFLLYNLIFFGYGEEAGWRGYALPRMIRPLGSLKASLLLSAFWALWHWPLFLYRPGYMDMDIAGATGWVLSLASGSLLLTWLFNRSGGSILVCAIFHATVDIVFTSQTAAGLQSYVGAMLCLLSVGVIPLLIRQDKRRNQAAHTA